MTGQPCYCGRERLAKGSDGFQCLAELYLVQDRVDHTRFGVRLECSRQCAQRRQRLGEKPFGLRNRVWRILQPIYGIVASFPAFLLSWHATVKKVAQYTLYSLTSTP